MHAVLVAGQQRDQRVGGEPRAQPPAQRMPGAPRRPAAISSLSAGRVVAHADHALALEQDQLGRAERLEHDEARALGRELGAVAAPGSRACPPGTTPRSRSTAAARARRAADRSRNSARELEQRGHGREVVVGARDRRARRDVGQRRGRQQRHRRARPPQRRACRWPRRARRAPGPAATRRMIMRRGLLARVPGGEAVGDPARRAGVEDEAAARRVVVGARPRASLGASGSPARATTLYVVRRGSRPPEALAARRHVVDHAERRERADGGGRRGAPPGQPRAAPRRADSRPSGNQ